MCMEGIEQNPVVYELMSEMAYRSEKVHVLVILYSNCYSMLKLVLIHLVYDCNSMLKIAFYMHITLFVVGKFSPSSSLIKRL